MKQNRKTNQSNCAHISTVLAERSLGAALPGGQRGACQAQVNGNPVPPARNLTLCVERCLERGWEEVKVKVTDARGAGDFLQRDLSGFKSSGTRAGGWDDKFGMGCGWETVRAIGPWIILGDPAKGVWFQNFIQRGRKTGLQLPTPNKGSFIFPCG